MPVLAPELTGVFVSPVPTRMVLPVRSVGSIVRLPMQLVPIPCPTQRHSGSVVLMASSVRHTPPPAVPTQSRQPPLNWHCGEMARADTRPEIVSVASVGLFSSVDGPRLVQSRALHLPGRLEGEPLKDPVLCWPRPAAPGRLAGSPGKDLHVTQQVVVFSRERRECPGGDPRCRRRRLATAIALRTHHANEEKQGGDKARRGHRARPHGLNYRQRDHDRRATDITPNRRRGHPREYRRRTCVRALAPTGPRCASDTGTRDV